MPRNKVPAAPPKAPQFPPSTFINVLPTTVVENTLEPEWVDFIRLIRKYGTGDASVFEFRNGKPYRIGTIRTGTIDRIEFGPQGVVTPAIEI